MGDIYYWREREKFFNEYKFYYVSIWPPFFSRMDLHLFPNSKKQNLRHLLEFFWSLSWCLLSNRPMFSAMDCTPPTLNGLIDKSPCAQSRWLKRPSFLVNQFLKKCTFKNIFGCFCSNRFRLLREEV